jgi:arylsulfatase A-like enzyme
MRGPPPIVPGTRITRPISSVDVTPTLLNLLGFQIESEGFEGLDALGPIPSDRKVYFSCWANDGPAGFVSDSLKYIYDGSLREVTVYDLLADAGEETTIALGPQHTQEVVVDILTWRKSTLFRPDQQPKGKTVVFETWACKWAGRDSIAKYQGPY